MKRTVPVLLILWTLGARPAVTQKTGAGLTDQQRLGRQILAQSCAVCHLPSGPGAKTYGPSLNKTSTQGDDDAMRETILEGGARMPAFKYFLKPVQIDAIIAKFSEHWSLERMPVVDRALLRIGTYELGWLPEVPTAVAITEAVELAKQYSTKDSGRFVNGLLARIAEDVRAEE